MVKQIPAEEVDAFMRQLKWLIAGVVALFAVPLIVYGIYVDRRLDSFEDSMRHSPPQELEGDEITRVAPFHLTANPVEGQVFYVPAYSHIYHGEGKPYLLTITLSVRNTSIRKSSTKSSRRWPIS